MSSFNIPSSSDNDECKVIDFTAEIKRQKQAGNNTTLDYRKVPIEVIGYHFNERRSLGAGLYAIRIYDEAGAARSFMSGVAWEQSTGDLDTARTEHQAHLAKELSTFYEAAKPLVKEPANIHSLRKGHMSFLAVKCATGIITAGWCDTKTSQSTSGLHMLEFIFYIIALLNKHDPILKEAILNHLPNSETVPHFDTAQMEADIIAAYAASGT